MLFAKVRPHSSAILPSSWTLKLIGECYPSQDGVSLTARLHRAIIQSSVRSFGQYFFLLLLQIQ